MKVPSLQSIRNYACHTFALTTLLDLPGDGRTQPEIPAADLSWALLVGGILRLVSANRLEWLANFGHPKDLGLTRKFGDDALAYFKQGFFSFDIPELNESVVREADLNTIAHRDYLKRSIQRQINEESSGVGLCEP